MLSTLRREFNIPKHFSVSQRRHSAAQLKFDSFLSQEMPLLKPKEEKRSVLSRLLTDPFKILPPYFPFDFVGSIYVSEYSLAQNHRPIQSDKSLTNKESCLNCCSLNNWYLWLSYQSWFQQRTVWFFKCWRYLIASRTNQKKILASWQFFWLDLFIISPLTISNWWAMPCGLGHWPLLFHVFWRLLLLVCLSQQRAHIFTGKFKRP